MMHRLKIQENVRIPPETRTKERNLDPFSSRSYIFHVSPNDNDVSSGIRTEQDRT